MRFKICVIVIVIMASLSSCMSSIEMCPTYSSVGVAKEIMKLKAKSRKKMEDKFFKKYERTRHKTTMLVRR